MAAGHAPVEELQRAVGVVLTRYVQEAEAPLGNQRAIEAYVVQLQDALTAAMQRTNTTRFEAVRSCAHELAIEWLRSH